MTSKQMYSSLVIEENEVRLLDLLPGVFASPLFVLLRHETLRPTLEFSALSYTWGDPNDCRMINVNGHPFNATANLYDALQYLRHPEEQRTFWVDAICINQGDTDERNAQVRRMTHIYSFASRVEVWLGKEQDEFDSLAMDLVSNVGAVITSPETALSSGFTEEQRGELLVIFAESDSRVLLSLGRLFKRPWWTRIWIVQEVSLARQDRVTLRCGRSESGWLGFLVAAYAIEAFRDLIGGEIGTVWPTETFDGWQHGIRLAQCRNVDSSLPGFTLLDLLHQHRDCAATDPRDKIYGVLGLAADVDHIGIKPSYSLTPEQVYIDLIQKHVIASRSLDIICTVRYLKSSLVLPSWVPDWSTDQIVPGICINDRYVGGNSFDGSPIAHYRKYAASGTAKAIASFTGRTLTVETRHIGTIKYLGSVNTSLVHEDVGVVETFGQQDDEGYSGSASDEFNEWFNMILKCPDWADIAATYGEASVWETFCRTLIADAGSHIMMKPESSMDEMVDDVASNSGSSLAEDEDDYITMEVSESGLVHPAEVLNMGVEDYRTNLEVSWGKRIAILDTGHIGLVPKYSKMSDAVVIVTGCSVPLVVRGKEISISLIGESYFDGVMDGELMSFKTSMLMDMI